MYIVYIYNLYNIYIYIGSHVIIIFQMADFHIHGCILQVMES